MCGLKTRLADGARVEHIYHPPLVDRLFEGAGVSKECRLRCPPFLTTNLRRIVRLSRRNVFPGTKNQPVDRYRLGPLPTACCKVIPVSMKKHSSTPQEQKYPLEDRLLQYQMRERIEVSASELQGKGLHKRSGFSTDTVESLAGCHTPRPVPLTNDRPYRWEGGQLYLSASPQAVTTLVIHTS